MIKSRIVSDMRFVDRDRLIIERCEGKKVLHLGCTDSPVHEQQYERGRLLQQKLLGPCAAVTGIDIDPKSLEWLEATLGTGDYRLGDIEDATFMSPLTAEGYEVILLPDVLEHLNNPMAALSNIQLICNESSRLIVTVPTAYSVKSFMRVVVGHELIHPDHVAFYSPYVLTNLLDRAGFACTDYFAFVGGGRGPIAAGTNLLARLFPRLAEGVGVVARKS
jgi:2-polyprenyl-3-methyl-5-hydroxy-6-metoxy-1,4-benzoquinol methylase